MAELWQCVLCSFFCLFLSQLLSHLNTVHRNEATFSQKCGLPGCPSQTVYTSTNSLIKHVRTSHRPLLSCTYESVHNVEARNVIQEANDINTDETGNWFRIIFRMISTKTILVPSFLTADLGWPCILPTQPNTLSQRLLFAVGNPSPSLFPLTFLRVCMDNFWSGTWWLRWHPYEFKLCYKQGWSKQRDNLLRGI